MKYGPETDTTTHCKTCGGDGYFGQNSVEGEEGCTDCSGTGIESHVKCPDCGGAGDIAYGSFWQTCVACSGSGFVSQPAAET